MSAVPQDLRIDLVEQATAAQIDELRAALGAPDNPSLFPAHFLKATFPKIGGRIVRFSSAGGPAAIGFLFPRALNEHGRHYTLRLHRLQADACPAEAMAAAAAAHVGAAVTAYDVAAPAAYAPAVAAAGGLTIAEPSHADADAIRALCDPARYLGQAGAMVDRVLALRETLRKAAR